MGIWSEIKYALNDTLAKKSFLPLNKIVEKENYENSINTISFVNSILENDDNSFYAVDYGTTEIKDSAFLDNSKLKMILMPNTVKKIGKQSFKNCSSLKKIYIPNNVETIGKEAFKSCVLLENLNLPEDLEEIDDSMFYLCERLKSINISPKTKIIHEYAFRKCESLKEITLPEGLVEVHYGAFYESALTKIVFPDTVKHIGQKAVEGCNSLGEITIPIIGNGSTDKFFGFIFGSSSYQDQSRYVPISLKKVTISGNITQIDDNAFYGCKSINQIVFPDSLKSIGEWAFSGCNSITDISLPNKLEVLKSYAFFNCSKLTSIYLGSSIINSPELVLEGDAHFQHCANLLSIVLLNNVKKIPSTTFGGCTAISDIKILNPDIEIENFAFDGSLNIQLITYNGTKEKWNSRNLASKFPNNRKTTVKCTDGTITI